MSPLRSVFMCLYAKEAEETKNAQGQTSGTVIHETVNSNWWKQETYCLNYSRKPSRLQAPDEEKCRWYYLSE